MVYDFLTQVAISARKIIRYGIFFIIFILVGNALLKANRDIQRIFPPPPPATVKYGKPNKIPSLEIPPKLTYTLETPDGDFQKCPLNKSLLYAKTKSKSFIFGCRKRNANSLGYGEIPNRFPIQSIDSIPTFLQAWK